MAVITRYVELILHTLELHADLRSDDPSTFADIREQTKHSAFAAAS